MQVFTERKARREKTQRNSTDPPAKAGKKEEFPGFMLPCSLGTPFPRSALFLLTRLWKKPKSGKST
jgi:hypothetical protein